MTTKVTCRTEFECSYLLNHELHSHRYRLEITVDNPVVTDPNMKVLDFNTLLKYIKQVTYNKMFLYGYNQTAAERDVKEAMERVGVPVRCFSSELSVELFCADIARRLQTILDTSDPGVRVIEVKLRETNDSFATWSL